MNLSTSAVWHVKTDLDAAPTGNGILYVEPSLKKIEKLRVHFSNIATRISSKWRALKKINLRAKGYFLLLSICLIYIQYVWAR